MIKIYSFGVKGDCQRPQERLSLAVDCRCLPNPFSVPHLKDKTGLDQEVQEYVASNGPMFKSMVQQIVGSRAEGAVFGCWCIGGRHRSVALAEAAAKVLRTLGYQVQVHHLSLNQKTGILP